jgi:hypothetical protein
MSIFFSDISAFHDLIHTNVRTRVIMPTLVLFCAAATAAQAGWTWTNTQATGEISHGVVLAAFQFDNHGAKPVTVLELKFSCSCTEFSFKAATAAPGRKGVLRLELPASLRGETLSFVAFGSEGTAPTLLTIQAPNK